MRITTPKTKAGVRTIPMLREVQEALLKEQRKQRRKGETAVEIDGYTGFVFTNRNGYVHNPITINQAIKHIYTAYNLQGARERRSGKSNATVYPTFFGT